MATLIIKKSCTGRKTMIFKGRSITVDGRVWKYRIGKKNLVARAEDNKVLSDNTG